MKLCFFDSSSRLVRGARWSPWLTSAAFLAASATSDARSRQATQGMPGAVGPQARPDLVINEVSWGAFEYIEVANRGSAAVSLSGMQLRTSLADVALGDAAIAPGGFFLVLRTRAEDGPLFIGSEALAIPVAEPLVGAMSSTVVLVGADGTVLDAMSYGSAPDPSPLYQRAVRARQFASGQFIDIGAQPDAFALGRSADSADTNDLLADWEPHGGLDAYAGSPGLRNDAVIGGESVSVAIIQTRVNEALLGMYQMNVSFASHTSYLGSDANSTAVHTLGISGDNVGSFLVTGTVDWQFSGMGGGNYLLTFQGLLESVGPPMRLEFQYAEQRSAAGIHVAQSFDLVDVGAQTHQPFSEDIVVSATGPRGAMNVVQARSFIDWFGISRNTTASSQCTWAVARGEISDTFTHAEIVRDWPIVPDAPYEPANYPYTTEQLVFDAVTTPNPDGGMSIQFVSWESQYDRLGTARHEQASIEIDFDRANATFHGLRRATVTYPYPGGTPIDVAIVSALIVDPQNGDGSLSGELLIDGTQATTFAMYIDPPPVCSLDFSFGDLMDGIVAGAKKAAAAVATVATGAVCAVGTVAVGVAAGAATIASASSGVGAVAAGSVAVKGAAATGAVGTACVAATAAVAEASGL